MTLKAFDRQLGIQNSFLQYGERQIFSLFSCPESPATQLNVLDLCVLIRDRITVLVWYILRHTIYICERIHAPNNPDFLDLMTSNFLSFQWLKCRIRIPDIGSMHP